MTKPPEALDGASIRLFTPLDQRHRVMGATTHTILGAEVAGIACLAIAQYPSDPGVYLFYCSPDWHVLADTLHDSVVAAQDQAEFEFAGTRGTWQAL